MPATPPTAPQDLPVRRGPTLLALGLTVAGLAVAVVLALLSNGYFADDAIAHFLGARDAWSYPKGMWHWWGRPGYKLPTMLVAGPFGFLGCRIFSSLQTAAVAWLSYLIALQLSRRAGMPDYAAALAPAMVWLQPFPMSLAYTTLTETPAALYLTLAVWLYLRGNRVWACAALSPLLITRYETATLLPIWAGAVTLDALKANRWRVGRALRTGWPWACAGVILWAPLGYIIASALANLPPDESILHMFDRSYTADYGSGEWNHMLIRWLLSAGVGTVALGAAGAVRAGRYGWFVTALVAGLALVHTLIYSFGGFASGGYGRFLVPAAGLLAALAAIGLGAAWAAGHRASVAISATLAAGLLAAPVARPHLPEDISWLDPWLMPKPIALLVLLALIPGMLLIVSPHRGWRRRLARFAAGLALALLLVQTGVLIRPHNVTARPPNAAVRQCANDLARGPYSRNPGLTSHVLFQLLLDNVKPVTGIDDARQRWRHAEPGTLFLWDSKYGNPMPEPDRAGDLYEELKRRGRLLTEHWTAGRGAAVFLRLPDPGPTSQPTTP